MKRLLSLFLPALLWLSAFTVETKGQTCDAPAPGNFKSSPISNTSTSLLWDQVGAYTTYRLTVINLTNFTTVLNNVLVTGTSRTVSGLNTSSEYSATVKVQCSTGNVSPNASTLNFEICLLPAPTNLNGFVVPGAPPVINWSWDTVPGAIGYQLVVLDLNTGISQTFNPTPPSQSTNAIAGHEYVGTVAAICPNGGVSPNKTVRSVQVIIIEDVVQLSNPGCGMDGIGGCINTTIPAGFLLTQNQPVSLYNSVQFQTSELRRVWKYRVILANAPPPGSTTNPASSPFVEFKIAVDLGVSGVKFRSTGQTTGYSVGLNPNQKDEILIKQGTTLKGTLKLDATKFIVSGNITSYVFNVSKNNAPDWMIKSWFCKSCTTTALPGEEDGAGFEEIVVPGNEERNAFLPQVLKIETFPTPASDGATLRYELPKEQIVSISLFDSAGKLVREFISNEWHEAGTHQFEPEISNLPPGVYRCVLSTENGTERCSVVKL